MFQIRGTRISEKRNIISTLACANGAGILGMHSGGLTLLNLTVRMRIAQIHRLASPILQRCGHIAQKVQTEAMTENIIASNRPTRQAGMQAGSQPASQPASQRTVCSDK